MNHNMRFLAALLAGFLLGPSNVFARGGSHSSHSTSHSNSSSHYSHSSKSGKTDHVDSYRRSDGKYVKSYDRHPAHTKPEKKKSNGTHYKSGNGVSHRAPTNGTVQRDGHGRIKRSGEAKNEFKRAHPCPATGRSTGACPGYVIDHIIPLKKHGLDRPSNMQWQTVAESKAKDKWE